MVEKSWDHIYILIDIHGTVFKPCYHNKETYDFYKFAKQTLQELSKNDFFKLIMWTSSNKDTINDFIRVFNENDIHFDYVNENPEIHALSSDPKSSDFSDKFYFDKLYACLDNLNCEKSKIVELKSLLDTIVENQNEILKFL